jgi:hypothetical protein
MRYRRTRWSTGLVMTVGLIMAPWTQAADESPGKRLESLGLKRDRTYYVLERESEVGLRLSNARSLFEQYSAVVNHKAGIQYDQARALQLDQYVIELDHDIANLWVENEHRPARPNSVQRVYFDGVKSRLDALRREKNEAVTEVRRIRSQFPGPRAMEELEGEIKNRRGTCLAEVEELSQLTDSIDVRYSELAKSKQVQDALAQLSRGSAGKLKLGPSPEYTSARKQLAQLEKQLRSPSLSRPVGAMTKLQKPKNSSRRKRS